MNSKDSFLSVYDRLIIEIYSQIILNMGYTLHLSISKNRVIFHIGFITYPYMKERGRVQGEEPTLHFQMSLAGPFEEI